MSELTMQDRYEKIKKKKSTERILSLYPSQRNSLLHANQLGN